MSKFKIALLGVTLAVGASVAPLSGCAASFEELSGAEVSCITYTAPNDLFQTVKIEDEQNIASVLEVLNGVTLIRTTDSFVYIDALQLTLYYDDGSIGVAVSKDGTVGVLCGISYYASVEGSVDYSRLLERLSAGGK